MNLWRSAPIILLTTAFSAPASSETFTAGKTSQHYRLYEADFSLFEEDQRFYIEYNDLRDEVKQNGFTRPIFVRRIEILEAFLAENPGAIDAYWLLANDIMRLGESYDSSRPEEHGLARESLVRAEGYSRQCLELQPNLALCKFFLAAAIGKIATIDGVLSSLNKGKDVLDLLIETYNSEFDYVFPDGYTLQGLSRYALGIFHRVVPDFFLLRWFFGFSGDIDMSITMHREAITFAGGDGPCPNLKLSAAKLCKSGARTRRAADRQLTEKAIMRLKKTAAYETHSEDTLICVRDAERMIEDPRIACGYTKARQQETDSDAFRREMDIEKTKD